MEFDLELDNCFIIRRNDFYSLVVDRDCIKDKIEVGTIIKFTNVLQTYEVKSVFYDYINGIYVLGLEV